tara:strand:- start:2282 stop:2449 length:168 start_codon:yes stop_codon:yes gene_type:complete
MYDKVKLDKQDRVVYTKIVEEGFICESWYEYTKTGEQVLVKLFEESIPTDYTEHI